MRAVLLQVPVVRQPHPFFSPGPARPRPRLAMAFSRPRNHRATHDPASFFAEPWENWRECGIDSSRGQTESRRQGALNLPGRPCSAVEIGPLNVNGVPRTLVLVPS
jgi:hypothetical protein